MSRIASGQSRRLDRIILCGTTPQCRQFGFIFSRSRYPPDWIHQHTCFPSFVRIPPQMALPMQLNWANWLKIDVAPFGQIIVGEVQNIWELG